MSAPQLSPWPAPTYPPGYPPGYSAQPPVEPVPTLPIVAARWGITVLVAALVVERLVLQALSGRLPVIGLVAVATVVGYGPMVCFLVYASRRWGTGKFGADFGFRIKLVDVGWGPLTWISSFVAEIGLVIVMKIAHIPITSNNTGLEKFRNHHDVLLALAISAVIAAPFVEELMFRGLIMRGLLSKMPVWAAVGLQGAIFGMAHIGPERGVGNIGLVIVLAGVGTVFGGVAYLLRRIGPTIVAHAMVNTLALILSVWVLKS